MLEILKKAIDKERNVFLSTISEGLHQVRTAPNEESFERALGNTESLTESFFIAETQKDEEENPFITERREFDAIQAAERTFNASMHTPRQGPCDPRRHSLDGACE